MASQVRPNTLRQRDALAFAARQLPGQARAITRQANGNERRLDAIPFLAVEPQCRRDPERDIVEDPHMRKEIVLLEDHRNRTLRDRCARDVAFAEPDLAGHSDLESGDQVDQGRFSRTARPHQRRDLSLGECAVETHLGAVAAIAKAQIFAGKRLFFPGHDRSVLSALFGSLPRSAIIISAIVMTQSSSASPAASWVR